MMSCPAVTSWRAVWPMTNETSVKLSTGLSRSTTFFVVRSSAWIFVPSGMSLAATTIATSRRVGSSWPPPPLFAERENDQDERNDGKEDPDEQDQPV